MPVIPTLALPVHNLPVLSSTNSLCPYRILLMHPVPRISLVSKRLIGVQWIFLVVEMLIRVQWILIMSLPMTLLPSLKISLLFSFLDLVLTIMVSVLCFRFITPKPTAITSFLLIFIVLYLMSSKRLAPSFWMIRRLLLRLHCRRNPVQLIIMSSRHTQPDRIFHLMIFSTMILFE